MECELISVSWLLNYTSFFISEGNSEVGFDSLITALQTDLDCVDEEFLIEVDKNLMVFLVFFNPDVLLFLFHVRASFGNHAFIIILSLSPDSLPNWLSTSWEVHVQCPVGKFFATLIEA